MALCGGIFGLIFCWVLRAFFVHLPGKCGRQSAGLMTQFRSPHPGDMGHGQDAKAEFKLSFTRAVQASERREQGSTVLDRMLLK